MTVILVSFFQGPAHLPTELSLQPEGKYPFKPLRSSSSWKTSRPHSGSSFHYPPHLGTGHFQQYELGLINGLTRPFIFTFTPERFFSRTSRQSSEGWFSYSSSSFNGSLLLALTLVHYQCLNTSYGPGLGSLSCEVLHTAWGALAVSCSQNATGCSLNSIAGSFTSTVQPTCSPGHMCEVLSGFPPVGNSQWLL